LLTSSVRAERSRTASPLGSKEHTTTATSLALLSLRTYDAEKSGSRVKRL